MERWKARDAGIDHFDPELLEELVSSVSEHNPDPNLSYCCLALHFGKLNRIQRSRLVEVIAADTSNEGLYAAVLAVCNLAGWDDENKDKLIARIVQSGDGQSCEEV
jgi:hypothetical protein